MNEVTVNKKEISPVIKAIVKIVVVILFIGFIAMQIDRQTAQEDVRQILLGVIQHDNLIRVLFLLTTLIAVNYVIEAFKWRMLLSRIEDVGFFRALRGVLMGVLFSIFTPARIGELGGRVLVLKDENKLTGVGTILIGSIAQNLSIVLLGVIGIIGLLKKYASLSTTVFNSLLTMTIVGMACGIYLFFNIRLFIPLVRRIPLPQSWRGQLKKMKVLAGYSESELFKAIFLSLMRICTWACQYWLVMHLVSGINWSPENLAVIFSIFLLQSGLPLPPVLSILARSGVAVYCWGLIGQSEWNALAGTFVMYFFNLIIPSLIGLCVFMLQNRFDR